MTRGFFQIFPKKSIIGMIHLAGKDMADRVKIALEEIAIFEGEGIHGVIVEDYHGDEEDIEAALQVINERGTSLVVGINVLTNPYHGFVLAGKYNAKFIQFDTVHSPPIVPEWYDRGRERYQNVAVFGGVRFKYQRPTRKSLEEDVAEGISRCESIVTTGEGTGIETPTEKLREFRKVMERFPLIGLVVGAGVNEQNVREQLEICDAAIVGSYFKGGSTRARTNKENVRRLKNIVKSMSY